MQSNWTRRSLLQSSGALSVLGAAGCAPNSKRSQHLPNIVLVYPDQLRAMALSLYGGTNISTAFIDSLLSSGTHFPLTVTPNPVCSPARAGTLFGRIPSSTGVHINGQRPHESLPSIATILGKAGYECGYVGKWHLDGNTMPGFVDPAKRFGFANWSAYNFHHNYMNGVYFEGDQETPIPSEIYLPFRETELSLNFMERHKGSPFFLMVSYGPPHPTHAAPSSYRGELPPEWLNLVNAELLNYRNNVPEWIIPYNQGQNGDRPTSVGAQEYLWGYYSAILSIDESVRRLVEGIDALGITGETIICFASDHGDMGGSHGVFRKGVAYSEATDVPLGFSWPGVIHQSVAPIPASLIDIAPTLASLAGVAIPSEWQGQDLSPWLLGDDAEPPKSVYSEGGYNSDKPWQLIRTPNWSYSVNRNDGNPIALFDTTNDPYQMVNLVNSSLAKDVIPSLSAELMSWNLRGIY